MSTPSPSSSYKATNWIISRVEAIVYLKYSNGGCEQSASAKVCDGSAGKCVYIMYSVQCSVVLKWSKSSFSLACEPVTFTTY